MIIKRIYFPDNVYSQNIIGFKNILAKYELLGTKSSLQTYLGKNGRQIIYDTYQTKDHISKIVKILCIYEGDNKPVTLFYKTTGSGGNFLIDIYSFCINIGCIIDNKDEDYMNYIILRLQDKDDINITKEIEHEKEKFEDNKKLYEFKMTAFDIKVRSLVRKQIRRYIISNIKSLRRRGIGIKVALLFKKKDIQNNVRWGLENGWIK